MTPNGVKEGERSLVIYSSMCGNSGTSGRREFFRDAFVDFEPVTGRREAEVGRRVYVREPGKVEDGFPFIVCGAELEFRQKLLLQRLPFAVGLGQLEMLSSFRDTSQSLPERNILHREVATQTASGAATATANSSSAL